MTIVPLKKTVHTKVSPARAFDLFTSRMGDWWPKGRTPGSKSHIEIIVEPRVEGRWFERDEDGAETQWGIVLAWSPPQRLLLGWQLDLDFTYDPSVVTEVEIIFAPSEGGGTSVTLEHRNLQRLGANAPRAAERIDNGWSERLADFAEYADSLD